MVVQVGSSHSLTDCRELQLGGVLQQGRQGHVRHDAGVVLGRPPHQPAAAWPQQRRQPRRARRVPALGRALMRVSNMVIDSINQLTKHLRKPTKN